MDVVNMVKGRVRNSAEAIIREVTVSHGLEGYSISIKETAKSITVTVKESKSAEVVVGSDEPESAD